MLQSSFLESIEPRVRSVYRMSDRYGEAFHWLEAGRESDETLVMLHGFLAHSMAFRKVLEPLAEDYRVVAPDLPGHGRDRTYRSEHITPTIEDLIVWFEDLLGEVADDEPLCVIGHSLGALLGFIAAREQDRFHPIGRLVLISPGVRIGLPPWTSRIFELVPSSLAALSASELGLRLYEPIQWRRSRMTSEEAEAYLDPLQQKDRIAFMLDLGADLLSEPDRLPGAHRVDVPTLIITGQDDHLVPVETVRLLNSVIPDSRVSVLKGVGHCPMEDAPVEFSELVADFVG